MQDYSHAIWDQMVNLVGEYGGAVTRMMAEEGQQSSLGGIESDEASLFDGLTMNE